MLSKIIIFVTRNNINQNIDRTSNVVNCFQKLLSSWRGTTLYYQFVLLSQLWIAFKNYYLRDEEQLHKQWYYSLDCCELLSKIIIFVTRNNLQFNESSQTRVVNCFQKLLSSWRGTTWYMDSKEHSMLWIAFKNYYLRDEEQLI